MMMNDTSDPISEKIRDLTNGINAADNEAERTRLYIERAHYYELLGDTVSSVGDFLTALDCARLKPDAVHIKSMIALALAKRDQKEQALYWAMSAVDQDPCSAEGLHILGLICDVCGFLNSAIESLRKAIHLEPCRWEAVRALGSCLREAGRIEQAVETLSEYTANNPGEPLGLNELAWTYNVSPRHQNSFRIAAELYEKALSSDPSPELREIIERRLRAVQSA